MKTILGLIFILLLGCKAQEKPYRVTIDLQGNWQFRLDTANIGTEEKWYMASFEDFIRLPGTTDEHKKGYRNTDTTTMHLNREYKYEGAAWYRRKLVIPDSFRDRHIKLVFERTRSSQVWIDSTLVGSSHLLQSPQVFDVSKNLSPGVHYLTVRINNDLALTPYGNVHIYSDDTQTNWNGILGKMYLEAADKTHITNLRAFPDISSNKVDVELEIENQQHIDELNVELQIEKTVDGKTTTLAPKKYKIQHQPKIKLTYEFGEDAELWDEYQQPLYRLTAILRGHGIEDAQSVAFGMRSFTAEGTQFAINGRTTFLRGKHESAVFPLTGYPPMEENEWLRVFKIAKSYGINHYRFHSYCPPEAAFIAADKTGIYLQAELPFWGGLESDSVAQRLRQEGLGMLKAFANHPSFVMLSPGNEIWSGHDRVEQVMLALKAYDHRPLYTMGSNNNIGYEPPRAYSEFFVGSRVPEHGDSILGHTRLTHAFADARGGGILNTQTPSTDFNFDFPVSRMSIPLVSHEIGQYQIYPAYSEIEKYTGVLKAWNLEKFRQDLERAGMENMDEVFQQASGAWSAICYKAEMEAALRTKGMAGFQLLDLQDFPGQGTALVGILDAFMDSKDVVTHETWKQSCNDVVVLLEFPKYCWTNNENFNAQVRVANYSSKPIEGFLDWEIVKTDGSVVASGIFDNVKIDNEGLFFVGNIEQVLSFAGKAEKLKVNVSIPGTGYSNSYPVWVYPAGTEIETGGEVVVTEKLTSRVISRLESGAKVLLFPQDADVENNSVPGHFPPDFWNYGMFKGISERVNKPVSPGTLGLLMNPEHPLFNAFPTDFHTNWQWFSIIKASNSLILDSTAHEYLPVVQVIDNLERNHKLGLIFEFKVGEGKLLVCMAQLNKLPDSPEAVQLYQSILNYMNSDVFAPEYQVEPEQLKIMLQ